MVPLGHGPIGSGAEGGGGTEPFDPLGFVLNTESLEVFASARSKVILTSSV